MSRQNSMSHPLRLVHGQVSIPAVMMRGGTSKGLFFVASDLPCDAKIRDAVLLAAMGSPDPRQVDGAGGGDTLTSKVAIVSRSASPEADVDYLFAQVSVKESKVDTAPSCGNILAGVGAFAVEAGLVPGEHPSTRVRIRCVNTGALVDADIQTPGGWPAYDGDFRIDGVPGTGAPVALDFRNIVGGKTGRLFPTGRPTDVIDGVPVSCLDVAMPCVLIAAASLGKRGDESPADLNADAILLGRIERIRREAARLMGLGDVSGSVIPKVSLVSTPESTATIRSRYFVPHQCHVAHAVTGAICVASAACLPDTVASALAHGADPFAVVEHPTGALPIRLQVQGDMVKSAGVVSTCRRIFEGRVLVPRDVVPLDLVAQPDKN